MPSERDERLVIIALGTRAGSQAGTSTSKPRGFAQLLESFPGDRHRSGELRHADPLNVLSTLPGDAVLVLMPCDKTFLLRVCRATEYLPVMLERVNDDLS